MIHMVYRIAPMRTCFLCLATLTLLSGCSTLPSSGPTGTAILSSSAAGTAIGDSIRVVTVDSVAALPVAEAPAASRLMTLPPPPTDMVGTGDILNVAIYEAGVTLFGRDSTRLSGAGSVSSSFDPTVQVEQLPAVRVGDDGSISIPYAGRIRAAGRTTGELQEAIRRSLRGMSQSPQVLVSIREGIGNALILGGEVTRPGRATLQTNAETFSDVIALAGGYRGEAKDLEVRVKRGDVEESFRLDQLFGGPNHNLTAYPGDKITLIRAPRTFSVLGAAGRVDQIGFRVSDMNLAEAVAMAGGVNPNLGDPEAIFVLRYEQDADGTQKPVVYHLNMMHTAAFFLSQRMVMKDKDVLYIGSAKANQPSKLIQLVSQLFSPIISVTSAVQTLKN
jgi:polysaccharide export outer membrane protein